MLMMIVPGLTGLIVKIELAVKFEPSITMVAVDAVVLIATLAKVTETASRELQQRPPVRTQHVAMALLL